MKYPGKATYDWTESQKSWPIPCSPQPVIIADCGPLTFRQHLKFHGHPNYYADRKNPVSKMIASRHTTDESLCSRCKSLDLDDILSGRWTDVQCREPVALFGKRSTILHDEDCPLCQALLSIAAGDHDTGPLRKDENFCMFAIPSQLAYRGAK